MPNFWSKITQEAYECFQGPRTIDYDFDKKVQELHLTKEKIFQIRSIITSFPQRTLPLKSMYEEISSSFGLVFDRNSNYYAFMDDVCNAHRALLNAYLECCDLMKRVSESCSNWESQFLEVENDLKKRLELRKTYDHYDEKMEKLVKERNTKFNKGKEESESEIQKFENNEEKYRKAALAYVECSNAVYAKIQNLLDLRYTMVSPVVGNFLEVERLFYVKCAQTMSYFDGVSPKIKRLEYGFQKTPINYNAADSLRGRSILNKANIKAKDSEADFILTGIIPGSTNDKKSTPIITNEKNNSNDKKGGYGQMGNQMTNPFNQQPNISQNPYGNTNYHKSTSSNINNPYTGNNNNPYGGNHNNPYTGNNTNNPYSGNNNNPYGSSQIQNPFGDNNNNQMNRLNNMQNQNPYAGNNNLNNQNSSKLPDNPFAIDPPNNLSSNPYESGDVNPYNTNNDVVQNPYAGNPNNNVNENLFPKPGN